MSVERSKLQHELIRLDVTYKGYALLEYMKDMYFSNVKGADLQRMRPMFFKDAKDVKQAYDELVKAEIISATYSSGNISNLFPNVQKILELSDISSGIKIEKKATTKKSKSSDVPEEILDIVKHYNSFASLPRPSTLTPLAKTRIEDKLRILSPEQIKDGLEFASTVSWLVNKGSEPWCNISWVIQNIDGFIEGGKYRKDNVSRQDDVVSKYGLDSDNSEILF